MNFRTFFPWLAVLVVYNLVIAALVLYFMAHCELQAGAVLGERAPPSPRVHPPVVIGAAE